MKDAEDEAFDELAKRQGMWGGGFQAKRAMAADKMQEPVSFPCCGYTDATAIKWNQLNGVVQCHMCGQVYTAAQPAQEPVGYVYSEAGVKHGAIQRDLPNGTPLYAAPPKREWVGLTEEEREGVAQDYSLTGLGYQSPFKAIEAMLKEKNT